MKLKKSIITQNLNRLKAILHNIKNTFLWLTVEDAANVALKNVDVEAKNLKDTSWQEVVFVYKRRKKLSNFKILKRMMNLSKTHIEIIPVKEGENPFLAARMKIRSVVEVETLESSWWKELYDKPTVAVVVFDEKTKEGEQMQLVVKNSYSSLKRTLT